MSDRDLSRAAVAPPLGRICLVLACMLALPVSSYVTGSSVGSFRMFSDPHYFQLTLTTLEAGALRPLTTSELAPHLGLDARRWISAAAQPVYGETAASLFAGGLGDLASLACRLRPGAERAEVRLLQRELSGAEQVIDRELACAQAR